MSITATNTEFYFFWKGPLSQWFKRDIEIDYKWYNCCEQYMMAQKAILFQDDVALEKIMSASNPYDQKAYGRTVEFFDVGVWNDVARDIVFKGNIAKFTQHTDLRDMLFDTGDKLLVEASPYDKLWGIGLAEDDPRCLDKANWPGRNWMGEVLTNVREELKTTFKRS